MISRSRSAPALVACLVIVSLSLQGCVATTVAGATLGLAAKVTSFAVGVPFKVAGAALHAASGHPPKKSVAAH